MNLKWIEEASQLVDYLNLNQKYNYDVNLKLLNNKKISLLSIILMENSPFKHENGILKLVNEVLKKTNHINRPIDISNTIIECSDWNNLLSLDDTCRLNIEINFHNNTDLCFYAEPTWLTEYHKPFYYIGMFIRSCLKGSIDWSSSFNGDNEIPSYRGIKTNMLKKQVGMIHTPESFGDSKSSISNWLSSLLFKLLQWPGVEVFSDLYTWPEKWTLESLNSCIINRIKIQNNNYCKLTNIPTYIEKVDLGWSNEKKSLNVMMVQPILPLNQHFNSYGFKLDLPKYRAKHRRHVGSIAELILHNIVSVDSANEKISLKGKIDLIIFPELSISLDDIDILERLSDKTGAIIFSGLVFNHIKNNREINNTAIWIIPSKISSGRRFIKRFQGKFNMTIDEVNKVKPWRPYQIIIELIHPLFKDSEGFKLTGSVCYDATDIKLSADLKDKSHAYIISAMNKDISTFDNMVDALFYHMYQYVILVNSGEYGGSVAKAPYKEKYHKLITHTHGQNQVSISTFEMNMFDFRDIGDSMKSNKAVKPKPAGGI